MLDSGVNDLSVLDLLVSAVLLLDDEGSIVHANAAAEDVFGLSRRQLLGMPVCRLFDEAEALQQSLREARDDLFAHKILPLSVTRPGVDSMLLSGAVVVLHGQPWPMLLELRETHYRDRIERAEERLEHADANRELLRNLAHEVKNPLGGLRGAAQLLQAELTDPRLTEYTQVIIAEADRLHGLVDRLLAPHRVPRVVTLINIHEVCERVAALVMAEYGAGLKLVRDYDISAPELMADREQLIQALLNIVRNAAQVLAEQRRRGQAQIVLRTRVARQVTLARQRHPLVLVLHVIDNGPGIPESIRERVFLPLVTARDGGTGLGLSLVQTIIQQHGGAIDFDSRPGCTEFRLMLPLNSQG
ncbi:PAS domain-containing protein [Verticiella sediminum]|uniref:Sensory histidine kinase/phosphatase NtrB n=1 Tax=Verticiella sediminum TaxID=1247510 RepID=A0A556AYG4_9BURK|nr:nitrogen regulation protein NR(II) [Verticiella sediminum]TSH97958.1 PAS domain-containing protein [Verticiella sediminum]